MPYTCVSGIVMLVSHRWRRGVSLSLSCSRRWRYWGALAGGGRAPSATKARRRVDPGNARRRPAGWRRRRARARGGAALLALSLQLSLARTPTSRGNKRRKKHVGPIFDRPTRFGRGFSLSVQQGIQNVRARVLTRRCYSLISHCLVNSITVVVAQNTPLFRVTRTKLTCPRTTGQHKKG